MAQLDDQRYLRGEQYRDASNLEKRASLHDRFSTNPTGWSAWMAAALDFPKEARVLEIGAGPGYLWRSQGEQLPSGWQVTLSDFSPGMVAQAQSGLAGASRAYRFAVLDAQNLPFPAESFDGVIANHMLYHVPDRPRALAEIQRVLCPGGRFFAATNGKDHLRELREWIARAADLSGEQIEARFLPFSLENGLDQLTAHFQDVKMTPYFDSLEVTQAEPLVAYVQSMMGVYRQPAVQNATGRLRELLEAEILTRGAVHISKDSGLFSARK